MSKKRILRNSFNNSLSWVISAVIVFLTTPYMVLKLGVEGYGIFALFAGIVGYYGLLDLGLGQAVIKYVSKYDAVGDIQKVNLSINSALWVQIFTGLLGSTLLVVFAHPILNMLNISVNFYDDSLKGIYISAVGFLFTMLSGTLRSSLMGIQKYGITSKISILSNVMLNFSFIAVLFFGYGLLEVLIINSFFAFVVFLIYLFPVIKLFPNLKLLSEFNSAHIKELFSFSMYMFIFKLTSVFNNQVIRVLISMFAGPSAVTLYVVPMKIIGAIGGLLNNIATVLFPYASELDSTADNLKIKNIYYKSSRYINTFSTPIYLFIALFSLEILSIWMGKEFAQQDYIIMSWLAVAYMFSSYTMVPANIILGMGYAKVIAFFSIVVFLLGTIITIPLIYFWGVLGAAIGMMIIQIEAPIFIGYSTSKIMKLNVFKYLNHSFNFNLWGALLLIVFIYFVKQIIHLPNNYFWIGLGLSTVAIFYLVSILVKWIEFNDLMIVFKKNAKV